MKSLLRKIYRKLRVEDGAILDICTACRSDCMYCLHQRGKMAKPELMEYELFKKIVTILVNEKYDFIHMYQSGEPMLHPQIYDMIELVSDFGMKISIGTRLNAKIDFIKLERVLAKAKANEKEGSEA